MSGILLLVAFVLLLTTSIGFLFVVRTRGGADVMLAILLFGTTGVALTLVLGRALAIPGALNAALVLGLLAAVLGVTFAMRGWPAEDAPESGP